MDDSSLWDELSLNLTSLEPESPPLAQTEMLPLPLSPANSGRVACINEWLTVATSHYYPIHYGDKNLIKWSNLGMAKDVDLAKYEMWPRQFHIQRCGTLLEYLCLDSLDRVHIEKVQTALLPDRHLCNGDGCLDMALTFLENSPSYCILNYTIDEIFDAPLKTLVQKMTNVQNICWICNQSLLQVTAVKETKETNKQ